MTPATVPAPAENSPIHLANPNRPVGGHAHNPPHRLSGTLAVITAVMILLAGCIPNNQLSQPSIPLPAPLKSTPLPATLLPDQPAPQETTVSVATATLIPLDTLIDLVLDEAGGHWNVLIQTLDGEILYSRHPDERVLVASLIKLPVAVLFLKSLERQHIPDADLRTYLAQHKVGDLSYADLLRSMLVYSDEPSTDTLIEAITANGLNSSMALQNWGLDIDIYNRVASPADINLLWQEFYNGHLLSPAGTDILLELLSTVTDNDAVRLGHICPQFPSGCTFYNKRGTITDETLVVADSAMVTLEIGAGLQAFIITLVGSQGTAVANSGAQAPEQPTDYYRLDSAIARVGDILSAYLLVWQ